MHAGSDKRNGLRKKRQQNGGWSVPKTASWKMVTIYMDSLS